MEGDTSIPRDLLYSTDHIWILDEDGEVVVGITDFGQSELAEVVYIDLPFVGSEVAQGSPFGTIEAMKTVAELISPVSGEVLEINEALEADPRLVNRDPYGEGWMIRAAIHDNDEIEGLLTPQDYMVFITGEEEDNE